MPTLLEFQRSMQRELLAPAAASMLAVWGVGEEAACALRLGIYRNTCVSVLVQALRLSFPAVQRLVGADFFEALARAFIHAQLPQSAYLNDYGEAFPAFIRGYAPAASVSYLGAVAELEWAVSRALHAPERAALDASRLAKLDASSLPYVAFHTHPSVSLLALDAPADSIWRAVIDQDDAAMAAIEPTCTPVQLLIERDADGSVQVLRLRPHVWHFGQRLFAGAPLYAALEEAQSEGEQAELKVALADHLASGRFVDFELRDAPQGS